MKMSKKMLSIILALVIAITCVIPVFADTYATSGTCGENVTWEFDVPTRTLTISGEGEMEDYYNPNNQPWKIYNNIIKNVVIESGITSIGEWSFSNCDSLTNIYISNSVKEIGDVAFNNCSSLMNIVIPDSVTNIGSCSFSDCVSLENVTFGKNLSCIRSDAFRGCSSIKNVYVNDVLSWFNINFIDIESNPLLYAEKLFFDDELVTELVVPDTVTEIKKYAFYSCESIESVTIHENVSSIAEDSFRYCNALSSINVSYDNTTYKSIDGVLFSKNMIALLLYPSAKTGETYVIPNDVLIIKDYAFYNNDYIKDVTIPDTVATIGDSAFYNCDALAQIKIPDEVVSIGSNAFNYCSKLNTVIMGCGITSIGYAAFESSVESLYYNGTEEKWNSIFIDKYNYFNSIHYNCTNPDGHYTLTKVVNPSTCRDEGYSEYTCPCGYTIVKDYTYLEHTPGDWNISQYPTCTKPGHKYQRCTGCGVWLNDESIPATGHTAGEWQSIAPTCTESGLEGKCCTECGELLEGEIIAALGGSHTFGEWEKVDNRQARTCATCGYIEYKVFPGDINCDGYTSAKDARIILQCVAGLRDIDLDLIESADVNQDCNISAVDARIVLQMVAGLREPEDGWNMISYDTSTTGPIVSSLTVTADKTDVKVGDKVTVTVALSEKSGLGVLTVKANYDSSVLKPTGMKSGDLGTTLNVKTGVATMATATTIETVGTVCTMTFEAIKTGSADVTFDIIEACDSFWSDVNLNVNTVNINVTEEPSTEPDYPDDPTEPEDPCANGHNYTSTVTAPTCTEQGYTTYTCTNCADIYKDDYTSATGHNYTWYTISVVTCETDGVMLGECTVCGATDVKATLKTGHNIVDGVCQNCGYTENGENDNTNTDDNENVGNEDNNNEDVTDPSENCSCNCHKSGISNFFFKIGLFFQKIFGSNKYCGCGVAHY